ncbi:MAG: hypothetical protein HOV68_01005 [Streptomycetaceae bacterium]|nr:hypothetical protein [Streptomycetaceae bacterium]
MTPLALQLAVEEDKVTPGLLGFTVVAVLAVATWLLLKSMNKQLKRVDFEEKETRPRHPAGPADTPADGAGETAGGEPDERAEGAEGDGADTGHRETQGNGAK